MAAAGKNKNTRLGNDPFCNHVAPRPWRICFDSARTVARWPPFDPLQGRRARLPYLSIRVRQADQGASADNKRSGEYWPWYEMSSCAAGPNAAGAAARSGRCPPIQGRLSLTSACAGALSAEQRVRLRARSIERRPGAALCWGSAPARRPTPTAVTSLFDGHATSRPEDKPGRPGC